MKSCIALSAALASLALALPVRAQELPVIEIEKVPAPIVRLLEDYSRAWQSKDGTLLASTLSSGLRSAEVRSLGNAKDVPFTSFVVRATTQYSGNLAGQRVLARYKQAEDVATYPIIEESRIGAETQTFFEDGAFTFVRSGGAGAYDGWLLAAKDDLDVIGFFSPYHLWDDKPVAVLSSRRFTMITHPDVADRLRPVLDDAEAGYDIAARFWPDNSRDHLVMVVSSTTAELGRVLHETVDLAKFVAFVGAGATRERGWEPTGPRMFVQLSHLDNYGRDGRLEVFAHELVHAVTRDESGPEVSSWIEEGLANLGGGDGGRQRVVLGGPVPDAFPTDDRFVTGPVREIQGIYDQAQAAIQVLDAKFGRAGLMKFYGELGSRRVVPGTEEYHIRAAVQESLAWGYDEWVAAWRKELSPR